jgi:hypothetical protein
MLSELNLIFLIFLNILKIKIMVLYLLLNLMILLSLKVMDGQLFILLMSLMIGKWKYHMSFEDKNG